MQNQNIDLFQALKKIQEDINQQIALAPNRFDDLECPFKDEIERDVAIQFFIHEKFLIAVTLEWEVLNVLNTEFKEFLKQQKIVSLAAISDQQTELFKHKLRLEANSIYKKMLETLKNMPKQNGIELTQVKQFLSENLDTMTTKLCRGEELKLDEEGLIPRMEKHLIQSIDELACRIRAKKTLTNEDRDLLLNYQRCDTPHHDKIIIFLQKLYSKKLNFPDDEKYLQLFVNDAYFNIKTLANKIRMREYNWNFRLKKSKQLANIRDYFLQQFDHNYSFFLNNLDSTELYFKTNIIAHGIYLETIRADTGFCGEHAAITLQRIFEDIEFSKMKNVEHVSVSYYDPNGKENDGHAFIVVNRNFDDPKCQLNDFSTYNDDAIILDAWNKFTCYAKDYPNLIRRYNSFPEAGEWTSYKFSYDDFRLCGNMKNQDRYFAMTENSDLMQRLPRIMEEYHLVPLDQLQHKKLRDFLNQIIDEVRPDEVNLKIEIMVTTNSEKLISIISGFQHPVIAIHSEFLHKIISNEFSTAELKFAIAESLLRIKFYGVGIYADLTGDDQHGLDRLAIEKCTNETAAIEFLRKSKIFEETHYLPKYRRQISAGISNGLASANYSQRIKNIYTLLAQKDISLSPINIIESEQKIMDAEYAAKNFEQEIFFAAKMRDLPNKIDKINYLISCLPELKIELLPYELTNKPSRRVLDFCHLLKKIKINLKDPQEFAAAEKLINIAHESRIPGFDLIYKLTVNVYIKLDKEEVDIICASKLPNNFTPETYYFVKENNTWQVFYIDDAKERLNIDIAEFPSFHKNLENIKNEPEHLAKKDLKLIKQFVSAHQAIPAIGFFRMHQEAINDFISATSLLEAKISAQKIKDIREKYSMHFYVSDSEGEDHFKKYQKNNNKVPTGNERFFGSTIGTIIEWPSFRQTQNKNHLDGKDLSHLPWHKHLSWSGEDTSGSIANCLWEFGVHTDSRLWQQIPPKTLLDKISTHNRELNLKLTDQLESYSFDRYDRSMFKSVLDFFSSHYKLKKPSDLSTEKISFKQAFIKFFDDNWPLLIFIGYDGRYSSDKIEHSARNEAANILLAWFFDYYTSLKDQQEKESAKKVIKSFFLGREDKRDFSHLKRNDQYNCVGYLLDYTHAYSQFCIGQKFNDISLDIFTTNDIITFIQHHHVDPSTIPATRYCELFKLPFTEISLECLHQLIPLIKPSLPWVIEYIFQEHFKNNVTYPLVSKDASDLINLSGHYNFIYDYFRLVRPKLIFPKKYDDIDLNSITSHDLICIYRKYNQRFSFPSYEHQQQFGELVLTKIMSEQNSDDRISALQQLLFVAKSSFTLALSDINLKNRAIALWVKEVTLKFGKDDGSESYFNGISPVINSILKNAAKRDIEFILKQLATNINSQEKLSRYMGENLEPEKYAIKHVHNQDSKNKELSKLASVSRYFGKNKEDQINFLDFLSSPLTELSLAKFAKYLLDHNKTQHLQKLLNRKNSTTNNSHDSTEFALQLLYSQFWDLSLESRAVIIEHLLIPADQMVSQELIAKSYEDAFDYVANKLFPNAKFVDSDDHFACSFLKSYLKVADDHIRQYLLAAMLVTTNEQTADKNSVGKKLALLCEHMGPAYVKLAQAIHSHPATPVYIRRDLDHIKGHANPPPRWQLWQLINKMLSVEDRKRIKTLGALIGSASYNLALEVELIDGRHVVLLLLRENAEKDSAKGFSHLKATIQHCDHAKIKPIRQTVSAMIDEAARLSVAEMDKHICLKQTETARKIYPNKFQSKVDSLKFIVNITTSQILFNGWGYRFIERVYGTEFNDLPATTPHEKLIRKAVAKTVLSMELTNILRGGEFDSDRHGNQLRVHIPEQAHKNPLIINIGLYDFGEMSLAKPSDAELHQLAEIISELPKLIRPENPSFDAVFAAYIDKASRQGKSTHYLLRIRKAFLALHDFQKDLTIEDLLDTANYVAKQSKLHPALKWELRACLLKLNIGFNLIQAPDKIANILGKFSLLAKPPQDNAPTLSYYMTQTLTR